MNRPISKPCGTTAAYKRHRRHGETPCDACKAAWAEFIRALYHRKKVKL